MATDNSRPPPPKGPRLAFSKAELKPPMDIEAATDRAFDRMIARRKAAKAGKAGKATET